MQYYEAYIDLIKVKNGQDGKPGLPGEPGKDGEDGKSEYLHIRYSDIENPTTPGEMTTIPSDYIGIYISTSSVASQDPYDYTWSRFRGEKGENGRNGIGTPGADGRTSYVHIKWSDDGGKTFTGNNGENPGLYMGILVDFDPIDIDIPEVYTWNKFQGKDGIPGSDGKDGVSSYFFVRYSPNEDGSDMTVYPEADTAYMGTCNRPEQIAPTDYKEYTWARIKGADGIGTPGAPGEDGKTPYLHIKYSNDGETFTGNNGEDLGSYIGTYVDFNESDPMDFSLYKWKKFVGEDGKDGVGFTLILTNESYTFPINEDGTVQESEVVTGVQAYDGTNQVAPTIGEISDLPDGMTAEITNNGTFDAAITFRVTNELTEKSGIVNVPITIGEYNLNKMFSWLLQKPGTPGKDGEDGHVYSVRPNVTFARYSRVRGECIPSIVTFTAYTAVGDNPEELYDCWMLLEMTTDNKVWTPIGDKVVANTRNYTIPLNARGIRCKIFASPNSDIPIAEDSILVVEDSDDYAALWAIENNTVEINGGKIHAHTITSLQLATDSIKSLNYKHNAGELFSNVGTFFDLSNGQILSKNFSIDQYGNARFKGYIETSEGRIGGFTIKNNAIYNGTTSMSSTADGIYLGTDGINLGGGWFKVTKQGELYARYGEIGGWTITDESLYMNTDSLGAAGGMYMGVDGLSVGDKFVATPDGKASVVGDIDALSILAKKEYRIYYDNNDVSMPCIIAQDWDDSSYQISFGFFSPHENAPYVSFIHYNDNPEYDNAILACHTTILGGIFPGFIGATQWFSTNNTDIAKKTSVSLSSTAFFPQSGTVSLGSSDYKFNNLYVHKIYGTDLGGSTNSPNIYVNSNGNFYKTSSSSIKKKKRIQKLSYDKVNALLNVPLYSFQYDEDVLSSDDENYNKDRYGFIVEDLEELFPIAVEHDESGNPVMWNSHIIIPAMLKLIQNQMKELQELKNELNIK